MQNKTYSDLVTFSITDIKPREEPFNVLLCTPDFFEIIDVKNAYMVGHQGITNKREAQEQWNDLKVIYNQLALEQVVGEVYIIQGEQGLEDMVFCANQTFPWLNEQGEKTVVLSQMKHDSRKKEVGYFESWFNNIGYKGIRLTKTDLFEGMGDTIAHPFKQLLYGGYGHRSKAAAHEELSEVLQVPVVLLELTHPKFYHLDTCFLPLDDENVMLCKEAFTSEGLNNIRTLFKHLHFISEEEADHTFCLNAHIPYNKLRKHVIIQKGSTTAISILKKLGFTIHETNTSEYMKSGGSVFCMKMMVY